MKKGVWKSKEVRIRFPEEEKEELSLPYVNALLVRPGVDDFFITLGSLEPPEIRSEEGLAECLELTAKPLFRFAASRENLRRFIDVLQRQYERQLMIEEEE
jgi:hypothetical protein